MGLSLPHGRLSTTCATSILINDRKYIFIFPKMNSAWQGLHSRFNSLRVQFVSLHIPPHYGIISSSCCIQSTHILWHQATQQHHETGSVLEPRHQLTHLMHSVLSAWPLSWHGMNFFWSIDKSNPFWLLCYLKLWWCHDVDTCSA